MRFIGKAIVSIAVLGVLCVLLINGGTFPAIVKLATAGFGQQAGAGVQRFGDASQSVADGKYQALKVTLPPLPGAPSTPAAVSAATSQLAALPAPPSERIPEYRRAAFGKAWADVDHNGCDTRDDILARDLTVVQKSGSCTVLSGTLADPYTGKTIRYVRGKSLVDIDHVRALQDAWKNGAWKWTPQQRLAYANDPFILWSVSASENRAKGADGPADYMPPSRAVACAYVEKYIAISAKYQLAVTDRDRVSMTKTLATCH